jgi:hypothetical protein
VRGDEAMDIIEVVTDHRFYDYEAKYAPGGSSPCIAFGSALLCSISFSTMSQGAPRRTWFMTPISTRRP